MPDTKKTPVKKAAPAKAPAKTAKAPAKTVAKTAAAAKPTKKPAGTGPKAASPAVGEHLVGHREVTPEQRRYYVEVAAYYIAERHGFSAGRELADWTAAEAEIDRLLASGMLNP